MARFDPCRPYKVRESKIVFGTFLIRFMAEPRQKEA